MYIQSYVGYTLIDMNDTLIVKGQSVFLMATNSWITKAKGMLPLTRRQTVRSDTRDVP